MGKAKTQRIIANVMALALAVSAIPFASKVEVNAQPDTQEDDLTYQGASVYSTSGNLKEKAVIQGDSAEIYEESTGKSIKTVRKFPAGGCIKAAGEFIPECNGWIYPDDGRIHRRFGSRLYQTVPVILL